MRGRVRVRASVSEYVKGEVRGSEGMCEKMYEVMCLERICRTVLLPQEEVYKKVRKDAYCEDISCEGYTCRHLNCEDRSCKDKRVIRRYIYLFRSDH